jgi:hypothetical protein
VIVPTVTAAELNIFPTDFNKDAVPVNVAIKAFIITLVVVSVATMAAEAERIFPIERTKETELELEALSVLTICCIFESDTEDDPVALRDLRTDLIRLTALLEVAERVFRSTRPLESEADTVVDTDFITRMPFIKDTDEPDEAESDLSKDPALDRLTTILATLDFITPIDFTNEGLFPEVAEID